MNKQELLEQVNKAIKPCVKCRLERTRSRVVPGEGNPDTEIMFIGQCPGEQEDIQGRPFVGRAGRLLNELLESIKIKREDVYITNIVKDRPPQNRDPMVDEVRNCSPYLEKEIDIINPKLIVTLGRFASEYFIPEGKISQIHGQPHRVKGRLILPLYHPAAALRAPSVAEELRRDFKMISKILKNEAEIREVVKSKVSENQVPLL